MLIQPENRGGLIGQLRDYALVASNEHDWNKPIEQVVETYRSVSIADAVNERITVNFESRKARSFGSIALKAHYLLRATHTQKQLVYEVLPPHVTEALQRLKVTAGESEQEVEVIRLNPEDEYDEEEFNDYESMQFRHVRTFEYLLDGRGSVIRRSREDFYEDDDEGGVDIVAARFSETGQPLIDEADVIQLRKWGEGTNNDLHSEVAFLELVKQYSHDKKLAKHTIDQYRREMLMMMAFLKMEISAKEIQQLL